MRAAGLKDEEEEAGGGRGGRREQSNSVRGSLEIVIHSSRGRPPTPRISLERFFRSPTSCVIPSWHSCC